MNKVSGTYPLLVFIKTTKHQQYVVQILCNDGERRQTPRPLNTTRVIKEREYHTRLGLNFSYPIFSTTGKERKNAERNGDKK